MPTTTSWLTADRATDWRDTDHDTARAGDVSREIADDSVSITIVRGGAAQSTAQTVRLLHPTWPPGQPEGGSPGGEEVHADLIVLGTSSFDVKRGDRFKVSTSFYEVIYVSPQQPSSGERVEAHAIQLQ